MVGLPMVLTRKEAQGPQGVTARDSELGPDAGYWAPCGLCAPHHGRPAPSRGVESELRGGRGAWATRGCFGEGRARILEVGL